ncbi:proline-rich protein 15-like protein [Tachyglossus aculeatus]|uniref:proline-rich protein 15-like protein n=1 Tax=Tachyglossus aculeatus TaxID=9261 RepID=UPI0018F407EB|nr:proline-rich protein 15-like protein [Tachyglossus aculeatus]
MTDVGWWKLTFLRKKKSVPRVLYESPDRHAQLDGGPDPSRPEPCGVSGDFDARLEKIVDKNTKHVKVSHSGRFKEKKKVRASLAEHPDLFTDDENGKGQ